jgi:hypothetical protein
MVAEGIEVASEGLLEGFKLAVYIIEPITETLCAFVESESDVVLQRIKFLVDLLKSAVDLASDKFYVLCQPKHFTFTVSTRRTEINLAE